MICAFWPAELQNSTIVTSTVNLRDLETDLTLPRAKTNFLKHIINYSGSVLWNNLHYMTKTAQSLSKFKSKLASLPSGE